MDRRRSKRIVVDASVAAAAGGSHAVHPTGQACRAFLETMRVVCHRIVLSRSSMPEWKAHESTFARTWRTQMLGMRKVVFLADEPEPDLRTAVDRRPPPERDMLEKDCHLVEAALATDRIVASLDEHAHDQFAAVARDCSAVADILWINPASAPEDVAAWLRQGASRDRRWRLAGKSRRS